MSNPIDTKKSVDITITIEKLAEIFDKTNLTELEFEDESCRISLARNLGNVASNVQYIPQVAPVSAPASQVTPASTTQETSNAEVDYSNSPNAVKSPMVCVVYLAADPKSPNYVKVGDSVVEGDTVCLVEAMKTFNPVKAHKSGKVVKILVEAGDPVEYGEPLVIIE